MWDKSKLGHVPFSFNKTISILNNRRALEAAVEMMFVVALQLHQQL